MATATRDSRTGRVVLTLSRSEAEVVRALAGHLSFASPGNDEASSIFAAVKGAGIQRAYGVNVEHTPTGSFYLAEV